MIIVVVRLKDQILLRIVKVLSRTFKPCEKVTPHTKTEKKVSEMGR